MPEAEVCEETETAQRFLASAYDSVEGVLGSLETIRDLRALEGDTRGRLTSPEEDLIRAAVVFGCAGLDATLKQLIKDALPSLLEVNDQAHEKFEDFVVEQVSLGEVAQPEAVGRLLASPNPRALLIDQYVYALTGSSLQSAEEVAKAAGALGIDDGDLRQRIREMRNVFVARNEISHELDLQRVQNPGDRTRRTRRIGPSVGIAHEALEIAQLILNNVTSLLYERDD